MSILVISGAAIVVFLGAVHALFTLQSVPTGGPMTPTDPEVQVAMQRTGGLGLAPEIETSLYRAWTGFNLSHALGAIVSGLLVAVPALLDFDAALDEPWWVAAALILPPIYLLLSVRYWFTKPTQAISVAMVLITAGIIGGLAT